MLHSSSFGVNTQGMLESAAGPAAMHVQSLAMWAGLVETLQYRLWGSSVLNHLRCIPISIILSHQMLKYLCPAQFQRHSSSSMLQMLVIIGLQHTPDILHLVGLHSSC